MSAKLVFLHGVGDGDPRGQWLTDLNLGLESAGYRGLARAETIAPRYSDLLSTDGVHASVPARTYKSSNEDERRRKYEFQQAHAARLIGTDPDIGRFGFDGLPAVVLGPGQEAVIAAGILQLHQVRRYIENEGLRGAILRRVLEHLPASGEIVLVGHSLGSVVAVDLLDHLPGGVTVKRFITIGSPAGSSFIHENCERLLKKFPYGIVGDWSNLYGRADIVTAGRGLGSTFPAAADHPIAVGPRHAAKAYFEHPSVAILIGEALQGSLGTDLAVRSVALEVIGSVPEQTALFALAFAHHVRRRIKDKAVAARYELALRTVQLEMAESLRLLLANEGRPLSGAVRALSNGEPPTLIRAWSIDEVVEVLVLCALSNLVQPYDVSTGDAPMDALRDMATELHIQPESGDRIRQAIAEVKGCLGGSTGIPWSRILIGVGGVALLAAGPLGVALAAPATAYGAAAVTGALAAFGPGGMIGGLAMLSGLTSAGAAVTAGAVTVSAATASVDELAADVVIRVSSARARQLLDVTPDAGAWYYLAGAETDVAAELNRLTPLSDPKSPRIADLERKRVILRRLLTFMFDHGLQPSELLAAEQEPAEAGVPG
ncbi:MULTISPECIES: hypothetical protein [unclassified Modestobacter]|uniref:hypothetical protein n=1 Tax=unclassified Modestobacter TaxID=2643866 RepID=UPI0022AAB8C1|nr:MULTISPECIES: hypothetical protein [unclassified Modestobacter]MCZ2826678.1 hypothetical protein [Modestobacter sp. VKM Ac-2981]MCZ2855058.1 hypothetical protein [Modestobacter sp. VKM Ac-2982]